MTVASASPHTFEPPSFTASSLTGRQIQASQHLRLAAISEHHQDITLHTREGDTVTLRLDRDTLAVYGRDARLRQQRHGAEDADGRRTAYEGLATESREWFGFASNRTLSLSIEGDLSHEEISDIRKALHRIDRLMERSFGAEAGSGARRSGLAGLDSLAEIEVATEQSQTLLATHSIGMAVFTYDTDGHLAPHLAQGPPDEAPDGSAPAAEILGIVAASGVPPQQLADPLSQLFDHWALEMGRRRRGLASMVRRVEQAVADRLRISSLKDPQG